MTEPYRPEQIRLLLLEGLDDEELRRLCYDTADFSLIYDQLTPTSGKAEVARRLFQYVTSEAKFDPLLAWAKKNNPIAYEQYQPYVELPAPTPLSQPRILPIVLFLSALAIGLLMGGRLFFQTSSPEIISTVTPTHTPAPTALFTEPAQPDEILILVTEFAGAVEMGYKPGQRIYNELDERIRFANLPKVKLALAPTGEPPLNTSDEAKKLGQVYHSTFVIWGYIDKAGMVAHFSVTAPANQEAATAAQVLKQAYDPLDLEEFSLFTHQLPDQMTFFSAFAIGQIYYRQGNYQSAREAFELALASQPELSDVADRRLKETLANFHFYQGLAAYKLNDLAEALTYYQQATELAPALYQAHYNTGLIYLLNRSAKEATAAFDEAIKYIKNSEDLSKAYISRGISLTQAGQLEEAMAAYNRVLGLDQDNIVALLNQAVIYERMDNLELALKNYDWVLEQEPNYPPATFNRATLYLKLKNYEAARADYRQIIETDPQDSYQLHLAAQGGLAWIYYEMDDYPNAINLNQALLTAHENPEPNTPEFDDLLQIRYNLALALLADGQTQLAEEQYNIALALSLPDRPDLIDTAITDLEDLLEKRAKNAPPGAQEILEKLRERQL